MSHPREILLQLLERGDLSQSQAEELLTQLADPALPAALAGALLAALSAKGVVVAEVRGFALAMRRLARRPDLPPGLRAIDIVGTGGDASGSLNISTGTALLAAFCGLPVIKHGNRSVSSRCGSADVLEARGLAVQLDAQAAADCWRPPASIPSCSRPTTTPRPGRSQRCARAPGCARCSILAAGRIRHSRRCTWWVPSLEVARLIAETLPGPADGARVRRPRCRRLGRAHADRPVHALPDAAGAS